ncbi:hypothetical protein A1Q_1998 [Vibrio campbellii HY01]|nr:hypothetical protein A1Q_1998 [Vibrio campbellii HY01]
MQIADTKRANPFELALSKRLVGWRKLILVVSLLILFDIVQFDFL